MRNATWGALLVLGLGALAAWWVWAGQDRCSRLSYAF